MKAIPVLRTALVLLCSSARCLGQSQGDPARPQTPQPPFPYESREVAFESPAGSARLVGTLTMPRQNVPAPAVVLVPGAGAVDRDDTILGHKPFSVLADCLARRGVAALRLDSRGIGGSAGKYADASGEILAEDLLGAVRFLKAKPEIDPQQIGLIGHSQGGMVAALAGARSADVAFLVLLASPGLPDTDLISLRLAAGGRARGASPEEIAGVQAAFRAARTRQARGEDDPAIRNALVASAKLMLPAGVDPPAAALAAAVDQQIAAAKTPNAAYFLAHDPRESYRRLRCPVLAMNGSLDQNVPARENLAALEQVFREAKNAAAQTVELEGLNHFFQTAKTGSFMEIGQIEETFSPKAMELIGTWISTRATGAPQSRQ